MRHMNRVLVGTMLEVAGGASGVQAARGAAVAGRATGCAAPAIAARGAGLRVDG